MSRPDPQAMQSGAVGQRLGDVFKLKSVPALVTNHLHVSRMAVTVIKSDDPVLGLTASVATEDAYLVGLLLRTAHDHQIWEDDRPFPQRTVEAGQFLLRDLNRSQAALIDRPHHSMHFYLPRAALDEIADDLEAPRIRELRHLPAIPFSDPIVAALGASLVPAFDRPREVNRMYVERVTFALGARRFQHSRRRGEAPLLHHPDKSDGIAEVSQHFALRVRRMCREAGIHPRNRCICKRSPPG